MPHAQGVLETALYVHDPARAIAFYREVLGLRLLVEFENQRGAAFRLGESILLLFDPLKSAQPDLMEGLPSHSATGEGHVAFHVAPEDLPEWREHLQRHGIAIEKEFSFRGQPPSIYFRDPDGNLLELAVAAIWPR